MKWLISTLLLILNTALIFSADIAVVTLAVGDKYKDVVAVGIENKRAYCERHGYDFICCEQSLDKDRPISWSKILLIQQVMQKRSYKWIFWTDGDSLIMNHAIPLEDLIDNKYNFILSKDFNNVNCGQFLIRNCSWSKRFLKKVYEHTECINHSWWEQQAVILELNNKEYMELTKIIPQRLINSYPVNTVNNCLHTYQPGDFIIHFAGIHALGDLHSLMESYSKQVITNDTDIFTLDYYLGIYCMKLSSCGYTVNEGYMTNAQKLQFNQRLTSYTNVKRVVEIGFNAGHSCENFFLNLKNLEKLVAFDINTHPYTKVGVEYMTRKYKDLFEFVQGDSLVAVPKYANDNQEKFDLIYVDARHTYYNCLNDIINAGGLAHPGTILWVDDYGGEVQAAVNECVNQGIIAIDFVEQSYDPAGCSRDWVQARYL